MYICIHTPQLLARPTIPCLVAEYTGPISIGIKPKIIMNNLVLLFEICSEFNY